MFWQDENNEQPSANQDEVVDIAFRVVCPTLPLDHTQALYEALRRLLPWIDEEPLAGVHGIPGAASGNGWYRPEAEGAIMHLSRRSRLTLRLPRRRLAGAEALVGAALDIDGHRLELGETAVKPLLPLSDLIARHVVADERGDEEAFLGWVASELKAKGLPARKLLCGRSHRIRAPQGRLLVRSILVADLDKEASLALQEDGIGPGRLWGCGLFIPHKGIAPVANPKGE